MRQALGTGLFGASRARKVKRSRDQTVEDGRRNRDNIIISSIVINVITIIMSSVMVNMNSAINAMNTMA